MMVTHVPTTLVSKFLDAVLPTYYVTTTTYALMTIVSQPLVVFSQASAVMMKMHAQSTPATHRRVVLTPQLPVMITIIALMTHAT
jgi:hypothetical protein